MTEPTTFRLDKKLKDEAYAVFKKLGLKPSQAIQLFLGQVALRRSIPFELATKIPNKETLAAFEELKNIDNLPSFESFDEYLESIDAQ